MLLVGSAEAHAQTDGSREDPKVTRMEQSAADTRRQGTGERLS